MYPGDADDSNSLHYRRGNGGLASHALPKVTKAAESGEGTKTSSSEYGEAAIALDRAGWMEAWV